jgi:hypothetical protein
MEEDITVLYCLIDDAYAHLNPNARRYESLKRLATRIALKIAADTYPFLVNRRLGLVAKTPALFYSWSGSYNPGDLPPHLVHVRGHHQGAALSFSLSADP